MKRTKVLLVYTVVILILIFAFTGCKQIDNDVESKIPELINDIGEKTSDNNPIDKAFKKDFEIASATSEINYVTELYMEAWKSEWTNITNEITQLYSFDEDKQKIKDYKNAFDEFVSKAFDVELLNWSDTSVPPGTTRPFGTGAVGSCSMTQAELYKTQVLSLISRYEYAFDDGYKYIYSGTGAEIEKLRN